MNFRKLKNYYNNGLMNYMLCRKIVQKKIMIQMKEYKDYKHKFSKKQKLFIYKTSLINREKNRNRRYKKKVRR